MSKVRQLKEGERYKIDIRGYTPNPNDVLCELAYLDMTEGGMHLPESAIKAEKWMLVVKVGPLVSVCQPGDIVMLKASSAAIKLQILQKKGELREMLQFPQMAIAGTYNPQWDKVDANEPVKDTA